MEFGLPLVLTDPVSLELRMFVRSLAASRSD